MTRRAAVEEALRSLRKYDRPGPRYTSYPTAVEFDESYDASSYLARLSEADSAAGEPLSLYVHLPFCSARCHFCGCNVVIAPMREVGKRYLEYLHREIDLLAAHLPNRRVISQYHWGGGTPTYHDLEEMTALHRKVTEHFELEPNAEAAVEVDPRVTTREQADLLIELGFNRLSMGVQDFTPAVQEAIGRHQSEEQTRRLYADCREAGFDSINIDLIYGLPGQTPEDFDRTMDSMLELRPERVAVYSYAYVPWIKSNQKRIDESLLPSPELKLELFCIARERFLEAGYVQIGMDHFALPNDELALAAQRRTLHRNFMGYTVKMGADMLGVGISSIGDLRGSFAQNVKKLSTYYKAIDAGTFPVERGYILDDDDLIRREVITRLMCNFHLSLDDIEKRFDIDFGKYFEPELAELSAPDGPVKHGFLEIHPDRLEVAGNGKLFIRNICMIFDRYMRDKLGDTPVFSRTV